VDALVVLVFVLILIVWGFLVFIIGVYTSPTILGCLLTPNCTVADAGTTTSGGDGLHPFWRQVLTYISPLFLQVVTGFLQQVRRACA
jgi:hypothetical protein